MGQSDGQLPLPHHPMLWDLHPTVLYVLPPTFTVSEQIHSGRTGTPDFKPENRAYSQLSFTLSVTPERYFVP